MALFKGLVRNCVVCGSEYKSPQSHARVLTCSRECGYKNRLVANKKDKVEVSCAECGIQMIVFPSHVGRRKFCSNLCREKNEKTVARKVAAGTAGNNPNWRGGLAVKAVSASGRSYKRQLPHVENEKSARRKRARDVATPSWADIGLMLTIYEAARRISAETGVPHHVDHIVPLTSDLVCGLHVHTNLQVLVGTDNLKKHNRSWPDMP